VTSSTARKHLLSSLAMADFVATGMTRLDAVVPDELNQRALAQLDRAVASFPYGTPLADVHPSGTALGDVVRLADVAGTIQSLVGPNPMADHHYVHVRPPRQGEAQSLHADAIIDERTDAFDVQMMYFPEAVGPDDGGTLVVPGTHFRRVSHMDTGRYQNVAGQVRLQCPAGTVLLLHHAIWHAGRRNDSDRRRVMYKLRLNPTVRQQRLWDTSDLDDPQVLTELDATFPWYEHATGRLERYNRVLLWRALTGDDRFDIDHWVTRVSNRPKEMAI